MVGERLVGEPIEHRSNRGNNGPRVESGEAAPHAPIEPLGADDEDGGQVIVYAVERQLRQVLGELSRTTQVLFFTHHAHLRDLAEALFPGLSVHDLQEAA